MIYYDYTQDDIVNVEKKKIENITGLSYDNLLDVSKKVRKIYSNTVINNEYFNRYKEMYYKLGKTNNICEEFIKRVSIVSNISFKVEKGSSTFSNVVDSMSLSYLITSELLNLPLFWNLDYNFNNNCFMQEIDYLVYYYYVLLANIFLNETESLKIDFNEYFDDLNIYNYDSMIKFTITKIK